MSIGVGLALNFVRQLFTWARRIEEPDADSFSREKDPKDDPDSTVVYVPEVSSEARRLQAIAAPSASDADAKPPAPLAGSVMDRYLRARAKREMG